MTFVPLKGKPLSCYSLMLRKGHTSRDVLLYALHGPNYTVAFLTHLTSSLPAYSVLLTDQGTARHAQSSLPHLLQASTQMLFVFYRISSWPFYLKLQFLPPPIHDFFSCAYITISHRSISIWVQIDVDYLYLYIYSLIVYFIYAVYVLIYYQSSPSRI